MDVAQPSTTLIISVDLFDYAFLRHPFQSGPGRAFQRDISIVFSYTNMHLNGVTPSLSLFLGKFRLFLKSNLIQVTS